MDKYHEKVKVRIDPVVGSQGSSKAAPDDFRARFERAGWTSDPGTGIAVLDEHGREIFNPVPMDPPIGFVQEPSMMDLIQRQINRHLQTLRGEEEVDSEEDALDFDMPEEIDPFSMYEFTTMIDEAPSLPLEPSTSAAAEPVEAPPPPPEAPPLGGVGS